MEGVEEREGKISLKRGQKGIRGGVEDTGGCRCPKGGHKKGIRGVVEERGGCRGPKGGYQKGVREGVEER